MDPKLAALIEVGRLQTEAGALFVRAEAEKLGGDYAKAHAAYQAYIRHSRIYLRTVRGFNARFPESPYEVAPIAQTLVNALMVDADVAQALGERGPADELRTEALELSRTDLGRRGTVETERSRAASLTLEGRFNEAIVALMGARDAVMEGDDRLALARVTIDLADIFQWLGDFRRAKAEVDHATSIIAPLVGDKPPGQGDILTGLLSSMSSIMAGRGDPGDALRAANLYRAHTEVSYYRGLIARALGEWDEAERCFAQVLPEYRKLGAGESIEWQLARIKVGQQRYREALDDFRRIAPVFETGAYRPKRGVLQRAEAECLHALGDSAGALRLVDESIRDLSDRHFDPDALWRSHELRARLYAGAGESTRALGAFRDALSTIDGLRRAPLGYRLDSTFLTDKRALYSQAIAEALRANAPADCCAFVESVKSRTLTAVLSIPRGSGAASGGLERDFDDVTTRLDALEFQAYRDGWSPDHRAEHRTLTQQRADLLERIRISDPRWRRLSAPTAFDPGAILKVLAERSQAALTLYYDPPELVSVLLSGGEITPGRVTVPPELAAKLTDYARNLQKAQPDPFKHDLSVEFGIQAGDLVPGPLLARALAARSLIVIPHGLLHLAPWAALMHDGARLFERVPVAILPNLCAIRRGNGAPRPARAALVGLPAYSGLPNLDDLPSAREEIEAIRAIYAGAGIPVDGPLLDEAATERAFWSMGRTVSGRNNLLHVSCHGTIVPSEPMSSGLLLADAKVDAAEVARAALPFDEVVLSACSTGWRPTQVGDVVLAADEILGIPGGFLEAGARSVLVSIPKAEGRAAAALTTHYHRRRAAGVPPLAAFQGAQQEMLAARTPPGTWVGFALYGDV